MLNYIEGAHQVKLGARATPSTTDSVAIQNAITGLFKAAACIGSPKLETSDLNSNSMR
jgi:hypothetical protein